MRQDIQTGQIFINVYRNSRGWVWPVAYFDASIAKAEALAFMADNVRCICTQGPIAWEENRTRV